MSTAESESESERLFLPRQPQENLLPRWSEFVKLQAIDYQFYQRFGNPWTPIAGCLYCLTRYGLALFVVDDIVDGRVDIIELVHDNGRFCERDQPRHCFELGEFSGGDFARHRVPIPYWAWDVAARSVYHLGGQSTNDAAIHG